ncbi:M28 family peptidase [Paenibacillus mesophilus]|uniref:M28 family peptidase n=1 Tax=Paenibacillus mesophilus TaxID=2582849 RepID=UPI00110E0DA8|nr:M28 family peptidase [Paenibacillus mesophilus]TMV49587.1 M28 family peptidase [Paenibacillus mesophilus]
MKTTQLNQPSLLTRYGFKLSDANDRFSFRRTHACELLTRALHRVGTTIEQLQEVSESVWADALQAVSFQIERRGGECLVDPTEEELPLADIDLYMRGVARWLNELGIHTFHCCDGHGRRTPIVGLLTQPTFEQLKLLRAIAPEGMTIHTRGKTIRFECSNNRELLLQLAERLYEILADDSALVRYEAETFKHSLLQWLNIPGESRREAPIRQALRGRLRHIADDLFVDRAGNVCAAVYCGQGPTVLLSAHMDIYEALEEGRQIVQEGTVLRSTAGILGADDRAGITIILEIVRNVRRTGFSGTLKIAFTVEEEIGLVGSRKLDPLFLADVDAAIVVDRRGTRDIVTSCAGIIPFCHESYGLLFERAGVMAGMDDWRVTEGGSSDARILAETFGIPSVNLSAGYRNEHTERESVDYLAAYETVMLIKTVLHHRLIGTRDKRSGSLHDFRSAAFSPLSASSL